MDIRQYLQQKGFTWEEKRRPSGLQAIMNCPFHADKKKKFAISIDTGAFQCYSQNECGIKGSWYDFQKRLGDNPVSLNSDSMFHGTQKQSIYEKPKAEVCYPSGTALKYLNDRGLSVDTIKKFRVGMTADKKALAFPYFKNGDLVNIKYRTIGEKKMWVSKNAEPTLFNRDGIHDNPLVVVEGEIDCLTMAEYGIEAVSIPSGVNDLRWIENEWDWLKQFQSIYLVMDQDSAGRKAAEIVANRLGRWRCYRITLPYKDPNECLRQGITAEQIANFLNQSQDFPMQSLVSADYFQDDVLNLFHNPEGLRGLQTNWKGLNTLLRGWRPGELTVWTGINGSGKSTILNQVIVHLIQIHRKRCCLASLEMEPSRLLRWMMIQYMI